MERLLVPAMIRLPAAWKCQISFLPRVKIPADRSIDGGREAIWVKEMPFPIVESCGTTTQTSTTKSPPTTDIVTS